MIGLTQLRPVHADPLPRLWLVFFGEAGERAWWSRFFRPGFRHVCAAAWFDQTSRWMYFDPALPGIHVEIETDEAFAARFSQLWKDSHAILRMRTNAGRGSLPPVFWCVGAVKALLGVKSRALGPYGLFRDLLAQGAEVVERQREDALERPITATAAAGRPGCESGAGRGAGAGGSGADAGDAGPAATGNRAA